MKRFISKMAEFLPANLSKDSILPENCPICLDKLRFSTDNKVLDQSLYTPECGHTCHFNCLEQHFHSSLTVTADNPIPKKPRCPTCRMKWAKIVREKVLVSGVDYFSSVGSVGDIEFVLEPFAL